MTRTFRWSLLLIAGMCAYIGRMSVESGEYAYALHAVLVGLFALYGWTEVRNGGVTA